MQPSIVSLDSLGIKVRPDPGQNGLLMAVATTSAAWAAQAAIWTIRWRIQVGLRAAGQTQLAASSAAVLHIL